MKNLLLCLLLGHNVFAQQAGERATPASYADSLPVYNRVLSPEQMKKDLDIFRSIREKANSGLYRYRSKQAIDSVYNRAALAIKKPLGAVEFYKIILELTDFEGSCHNYTELPAELIDYLNRQRIFFPYALKYIEGKIIFNNKTPEIPVGARVTAINNVADTALMKSFYKYMPADGYTVTEKLSGSVNKSFGLRYQLEHDISDSFTITFLPPGSTSPASITVPAVTLEERKNNLAARHSAPVDSITDPNVQPKYSFRMINRATGLLSFRIFNMAWGKEDPAFVVYSRFIDSVFVALDKQKVKNLILDIRDNPGGSDPTYEEPMMYLTDHTFKENTLAYILFDSIPYEQYFWGVTTSEKMGENDKEQGKLFLKDRFPKLVNGKNLQHPKHNPVYHPKQPGFKGKLYLLIDEGVASAASHLASLVKAYARNAVIVGVETVGGYYGHNGHTPVVYELPNSKIKTKFSIVYVVQDAPRKADQPDGRGIMPDHEVWPTYHDFMHNRDTQMNYVLELIDREAETK